MDIFLVKLQSSNNDFNYIRNGQRLFSPEKFQVKLWVVELVISFHQDFL